LSATSRSTILPIPVGKKKKNKKRTTENQRGHNWKQETEKENKKGKTKKGYRDIQQTKERNNKKKTRTPDAQLNLIVSSD
jgi:hypothetical protein